MKKPEIQNSYFVNSKGELIFFQDELYIVCDCVAVFRKQFENCFGFNFWFLIFTKSI
jgi:hypothetical protein